MRGSVGEASMYDLDRVRYVTRNYEKLQGLKAVPFGLLILLVFWGVFPLADLLLRGSGLSKEKISSIADLVSAGLMIVILLLTSVFYLGARDYYRKRYGTVSSLAVLPSVRRKILGVAVFLLVVDAFGVPIPDGLPQVSVIPLVFGAALLAAYWPERRFRAQYLILAVLFMGLAFIPLLVIDTIPANKAWALDSVLAWNVLGLYCVIGGVFDHLLLIRTFKSTPGEDNGGAV